MALPLSFQSYYGFGERSMAEFRKLDLSCIESLFDLYSMIVDWGRFKTLRRVSLIFSLTLTSPSTLFHKLTISSLCLTLIVHPQISGHSARFASSGSRPPFGSAGPRHPSNWSPITARTRSSQIRSATPFFSLIIHFPPERLSGSSHTGRRMPEWKRR